MPDIEALSPELTLAVRDTCLCLHAKASGAIARAALRRCAAAGLTNGQFSLLMALNRPQAPSMGDVSDLLAMDRTTPLPPA